MAKDELEGFQEFEISHVLHEENTRADVLSQLASTQSHEINNSFAQETKKIPIIEQTKESMMIINVPTFTS